MSGQVINQPNYIIRSVKQGSYSQSHEKFGDSSGLQCCANSVLSICWKKFKRITSWRESTLDQILTFGDILYKKIHETITGPYRYLGPDDVPDIVTVLNENFNVTCHKNWEHGEIRNYDGHFSIQFSEMTDLSNFPYPITGFLLIMNNMAMSLFLDDNSHDCYLFDSHSRNSEGVPTADGTSVLIRFDSLNSLQNYLYIQHCQYRSDEKSLYQIHKVEVQLSANAKNNLEKNVAKYQSKLQYEKQRHKILEKKKQDYLKDPSSKIKKARKRYAENPMPTLERVKKNYAKNPEPKIQRAKQRSKQAYLDNPQPILERAKQRSKQAYLDNPQPIIERAKQAYLHNPQPIIERAKQASAQRYINDPTIKEINRIRNAKNRSNAKKTSISNFCLGVWEGPYYKCVICNRALYSKSVKIFSPESYTNLDEEIVTNVVSFDGKYYICITCHLKLKKGEKPCQAVANKLIVTNLPQQFSNLRELEKILVAKRILFKKVVIIHGKGEFPKVKGTLCNIPVNSDEVSNTLPREADSNGMLVVKLKRHLKYKGDYLCEPVRPRIVIELLNYLKENNPLYQNIDINPNNIDNNLVDLEIEDNQVNTDENELNADEVENDLDDEHYQAQYQVNSNNSVLVQTVPHVAEDENLIVAPGQEQTPLSMLTDENCEELAFPHLFPTGKYGYKIEREIPLSPSKYFNQRLLNHTQNFASDSNYIFYARSLLENVHIQSSINVAMRMMRSTSLTAGCLQTNFNETVSSFVSNSNAFKFLRSVCGSPAYWKQFLVEVLAMVKQLGLPSYFFTLSCADLRWDELIFHIARLNNITLSKEEIAGLSYHERTRWLNANPVLLARHFQYRTQLFFKDILLDGTLGKAQYYAYRVEFQHRGSPHIHGFLWIKDFPQLTPSTTQDYIDYLDQVVFTSLPDPATEPELFNFVKTYQMHHHSRTCWKYKKSSCRFHFGKLFTERTIISLPLPDEMQIEQQQEILERREAILSEVKDYINEYLNPSKRNIIDPSKENYEQPKSIDEILLELDISKDDYYELLSISPDKDFQIHFRRPSNSCFVNNYFKEGILAWQANIDIQPIFNHYKAVTYMCSYFSKSEEQCTLAMMQAVKEALESNQPYRESMKRIALAYANNRDCSVQEAVYHCLPELHLRRVFPAVVFANSNLPSERFRVLKTKEEIDELPEDSNDIYKKGELERYMDRPNQHYRNGRFAILDSFCFVEFLANYDLQYKNENLDYQPDQLPDELIESNHDNSTLPPKFTLMNSKDTYRLRKVKKVVRYGIPKNRDKNPEKYAHHLLALFYPFRKESDLLSGNPLTYCSKLNDPEVIEFVNRKRQEFEPFAELVDEALLEYSVNAQPSYDPEGQVENDETDIPFDNDEENDNENEDRPATAQSSASPIINPLVMPDHEICERINSLNKKQRDVFNIILAWARRTVKYNCLVQPKKVDPFYIFLSGSGGCGKSHLIKTIYHAVSKTFLLRSTDLLKPRILLLAPTGVASINIEGTTIHTGLCIRPNSTHHKLSDKQRSDLRNKFSDVKLIIIDEISMVSIDLLYRVSLRLTEIFGYQDYVPFAGIPVIVCGDLFQLPPINARPVYYQHINPSKMEHVLQSDLWKKFQYVELTEIMRQSDQQFIQLLNRVRVGETSESDFELLSKRFENDDNAPERRDILHIFAENDPATEHNKNMLASIENELYIIPAKDVIPQDLGIPNSKINDALKRKPSQTGGLAKDLKIKVGAKVMLTANIDLSDKLINGLMGNICHVKISEGAVKVIYVRFENHDAGANAMSKDEYGRLNNCVPIFRTETDIKIDTHLRTSPVIKRTQFPISLSWACTVHKVQGLSIPEAVISFDLIKQRSFRQGQMYVALSRVKSLEGLYLTGTLKANAIKVNESAKTEYDRLKENCMLPELPKLMKSGETLTITLSNVRSLCKHIDDIFRDAVITNSDVIGFTETGVLREDDITHMQNRTDSFNILYNNSNEHPECSLAASYSPEVTINEHIPYNSLSVIDFKKPEFSNKSFKIVLLYKKNNVSLDHFLETLQYFSAEADIIMGDFNINALTAEVSRVIAMLEDFQLIHNEPTHLQGGLLDHVYIRTSTLQNYPCESIIHPVFYSDHDVVKFQLRKYDIDFTMQ